MPSEHQLARLERAARLERLRRIEKELAAMPPRPPATREELLKLKEDLNIPDAVFAELFPEV